MDDMQSLYQNAMENLAKSTAAVPMHLQGATGALAWWESSDSLLAKAEMPWDKKDEEEAAAEDEEREEGGDEGEEEEGDEDGEDEDDEGMKKSVGDDMARIRQKGRDREMSGNDYYARKEHPNLAQRMAQDTLKYSPDSIKRFKRENQTATGAVKKLNTENIEYARGMIAGAKAYLRPDVAKALTDLSAAADRLSSPMESDESPLLKSIAALNRLAGA